jgi:SAM-dependent methyltransferase
MSHKFQPPALPEDSASVDLRRWAPRLRQGGDGIWYATGHQRISYPVSGNARCFQIEANSFWFAHRNACIEAMIKSFPPRDKGPIFDLGGGNGFVSKALVEAGWKTVLVEPGQDGARNAKKRGLPNVVCASTESADFLGSSMPAIGIFDVLEHIKEDTAFLRRLHNLLEAGGMLYLTVPAYNVLWSHEDVHAEHQRRYSLPIMREACSSAGFEIQFISGIFAWLIAPIFLFRATPYRLSAKAVKDHLVAGEPQNDHVLPPWLSAFAAVVHAWELRRIAKCRRIPFGASLMLAARKT